MDAHQYLTEIKSRLIASPVVDTFTIVEEQDLDDRGYFRARITLIRRSPKKNLPNIARSL
jgi:hypothetical protein